MQKSDSMVSEWVACLDKRPEERSGDDIDLIYSRLKGLKAFEKFHPMLLQQICLIGYYEDLEPGIILFRQGDIGTNWYAVLSGTLDVNVNNSNSLEDITLCTLGIGTAFGESIISDIPRNVTVITSEFCELLRVEQHDFKVLWERNKDMMEGLITPLSSLTILSDPCNVNVMERTPSPDMKSITNGCQSNGQEDLQNSSAPITTEHSEKLSTAGKILRTALITRAPHMILDRKYHLRTYKRSMVGSEMVEWLMHQSPSVSSRNQAVAMWQALLEEGVIVHVCREHQFKDRYLFYRFSCDEDGGYKVPTQEDKKECEELLSDILSVLANIGPDAMMRMILRKLPHERTVEDHEIIYEELLHIKALAHLSTMVKHELASVLAFESHAKKGTVVFNQGDEGKSWYIILKGSVNVVIYGKGVVCTLHEGDDFGKLALVNDACRSATIVLREDNCHFLRVDKDDFNRILRDVEANTVRLKEHGHDVLVLEKIPLNNTQQSGMAPTCYKYSVMAGTPEKMLEHLLETRIKKSDVTDTFLEDFLLTHVIFMPSNHLCPTLMAHYHSNATASTCDKESDEFALSNKRRVVAFVEQWYKTIADAFWEDKTIQAFLEELIMAVTEDCKTFIKLNEELESLNAISQRRYCSMLSNNLFRSRSPNNKICPKSPRVESPSAEPDHLQQPKAIKPTNEVIFKVYCADHTYTTLKVPVEVPVEKIILIAAEKLGLGNNCILCEVKSNGERRTFRENDIGVMFSLSVNGQLFLSPRDHLDALTPLPEQESLQPGGATNLDFLNSRDIAHQLTLYDWALFTNIQEYELIFYVFGRHHYKRITANLDIFLRHFNEIQFWVVTEICQTANVGKRVQLLRKFIKIALYCKEYQNMNAFFAIVMGLSNIAVSRLSQTWEKVPGKFKKLFVEFELMMDPSRNHRSYRLSISKMNAPILPFMPLMMKDATFTHEGNKTHFDGLINFEKMHMLADTLRIIKHCRSKPLDLDSPTATKNIAEVRHYVRNLKVIDNQRILTQLSHKHEPRKS